MPDEPAWLQGVVRDQHVNLAMKRRGRSKREAGSRIRDVCYCDGHAVKPVARNQRCADLHGMSHLPAAFGFHSPLISGRCFKLLNEVGKILIERVGSSAESRFVNDTNWQQVSRGTRRWEKRPASAGRYDLEFDFSIIAHLQGGTSNGRDATLAVATSRLGYPRVRRSRA